MYQYIFNIWILLLLKKNAESVSIHLLKGVGTVSFIYYSLIHRQYTLYPDQSQSESGGYPRKTGHEVGIQPGSQMRDHVGAKMFI